MLALVLVLLVAACGEGREDRVVPDVRGERLDRAERLLAEQKLDASETGAEGAAGLVRKNWTVCAQHPAPGKLARSVRLVVARTCAPRAAESPEPQAVIVPDVTGESLEDAKEELHARGLIVGYSTDDGDPVLVDRLWHVCDQEPYGGERARFVHLDVAHVCWED